MYSNIEKNKQNRNKNLLWKFCVLNKGVDKKEGA